MVLLLQEISLRVLGELLLTREERGFGWFQSRLGYFGGDLNSRDNSCRICSYESFDMKETALFGSRPTHRERTDAPRRVRMLALSKYGKLGASSRLRTFQYVPWLRAEGIDVDVQELFSSKMLERRYRIGRYTPAALFFRYVARLRALTSRTDYDLLWIEKEALPWTPLWFELCLLSGRPYVLDYDDAVFHKYDMHRNRLLRWLFGRRLDGLMRRAALVVCGSDYLAARARAAGAERVEVVPTVVDLVGYSSKVMAVTDAKAADPALRIVWIGSPSTAQYLDVLREPLRRIAGKLAVKVRIIGGGVIELPGVDVESLPWDASTEADSLRACDIGVMPLIDSPWERGKCGFKLIQYMAVGLPVVASNVGMNSAIVQHGRNGFLASTTTDWEQALLRLLYDETLRDTMGSCGRKHVEDLYCVQRTAPRLSKLLRDVCEAGEERIGGGGL